MNLGGGGRVRRALVVNDDAVQSAMVATTLEKTGLAVTRVRHGEEAIEVATQGTPYAIIVTDLYMPVIDGWRLCRLLRSPSYPDYASVPIIVMSATFTAGEGERIAGEIGANAFLPFPYSADDLRGMVARLLTGDVAPTRRALVIMDESKVREPMGQGLAKSGYFVRSAPTAKAGMALFEQGAWDLVVLGYNLPDGNAVRLLPSFRKPGRACTVIVVTTDPHTVLVSRTGEGFVSDPIDVERFLSLCGVGGDDDELAGLRDAVERAARELDVERTRVGELLDIADPPIVRIDARGVITLAGASAARA
ncbi:response regulator, partial [bacterium]|nr:response regulator [bacterium]